MFNVPEAHLDFMFMGPCIVNQCQYLSNEMRLYTVLLYFCRQLLFRRPRTSEDEPRAGRPSTSKTDDNVERVRSLVRSDRRLTLRVISSELNFNTGFGHEKSVRQNGSKEPHD